MTREFTVKRMAVVRALGAVLLLLTITPGISGCGGCSDEPSAKSCDPADPTSCEPGQLCGEEGFCVELSGCDPEDPTSCPSGYACRPSDAGPVCEPEVNTGRIPNCIDSDGIDLFAVEANGALSITWNVNAVIDSAGGFKVNYGTATGIYDSSVTIAANVLEATLTPLTNGTTYFITVQTLDAAAAVTFTSCEIASIPHVLAFKKDLRVNTNTDGDQLAPDIASNFEGTRLYLVWADKGTIKLSVSTDFGDTWTQEVAVSSGTGQAEPTIAIRESVLDAQDVVVSAEIVLIAWQQGGRIYSARYLPDTAAFEAPVDVGAGSRPDLTVGPSSIHLTFENNGTIYQARSTNDGVSFLAALPISGSTTNAHAPRVAVNGFTGDVYIAWDAIQGGGDTNIYFASSVDAGASFGAVKRVDDDNQGQNQLNVSIAVDERSQKIYATWEDRRGGANVYFSWSEDWGASWKPNIDVGAGFNGDQFRPQAVVDMARNVYVIFQDTTIGQRPIFTRFNSIGSFDPPLSPSTSAGTGGVVGDNQTVAADHFGVIYAAWEENRGAPTKDIYFARAE